MPSGLPDGGRGVFTVREVPRGCIVTGYDGPLVVSRSGDVSQRVADYALDIPPGCDVPAGSFILGRRLGVEAADPEALEAEGLSLVAGSPGPGLAQQANDAVHFEVTGRRNNCEFHFPPGTWHAYLRTTRDLRAGEELLVDYNVCYWTRRAVPRRLRRLRAFVERATAVQQRLERLELGLELYLGGGRYVASRQALEGGEQQAGDMAGDMAGEMVVVRASCLAATVPPRDRGMLRGGLLLEIAPLRKKP
jgi:hypothetical protein